MARKKENQISQILERFSLKATKATGTSMSFIQRAQNNMDRQFTLSSMKSRRRWKAPAID
jgi:hypothetical protein